MRQDFFSLVLHTLTNIENNVLFVKFIPYLNTEYLFGVQKYTLSMKEHNKVNNGLFFSKDVA